MRSSDPTDIPLFHRRWAQGWRFCMLRCRGVIASPVTSVSGREVCAGVSVSNIKVKN